MPSDATFDDSDAAGSQDTDTARVWDMIQKIDICMLITRSSSAPRARPMSTIAMRDEGAIYLLTEATSSAARDVGADATVLLTYRGSADHLSVTGKATVNGDKALVKRLWSPGAEVFWPDGPEASNVVAIKVDPDRADYWDGPNPIVSSAKFLFGLITKQKPDMGERGVVNL